MSLVLSAPRTYKVTPSLADVWAQCPRRATMPRASGDSPALTWGTAIHELLKVDGRRQLAGSAQLDPYVLLLHGIARSPLHDNEEFVALAVDS